MNGTDEHVNSKGNVCDQTQMDKYKHNGSEVELSRYLSFSIISQVGNFHGNVSTMAITVRASFCFSLWLLS